MEEVKKKHEDKIIKEKDAIAGTCEGRGLLLGVVKQGEGSLTKYYYYY